VGGGSFFWGAILRGKKKKTPRGFFFPNFGAGIFLPRFFRGGKKKARVFQFKKKKNGFLIFILTPLSPVQI